MEILLIITLIIVIAGFIALFFILNKKPVENKNDQSMLMLQNQINQLNKTLDDRLSENQRALQTQIFETNRSFQTQSGQAQQIIKDVTERLVKLDETNKQVINFADQLRNLQDILKNPKQRGILGEYFLEETLKNALPPNAYQMQYKFKNGEIVDAVIFTKDVIIPIDSKFSLENYERLLNEKDPKINEKYEKQFKIDLKDRIDETSKYVRPEENTTDFAFMFIPSESIYYDLLVNKTGTIKVSSRNLIEYAFKEKHVVIVSPTNFLAYLQTVLFGLRALKIEEDTKEIIKSIEKLKIHVSNYDSHVKKLGNHLSTTVTAYNDSYKQFNLIETDIVKIVGGEKIVEPLEIAKPKLEE